MTNMYKQSKAILESDAERRNAEDGTKTEVPKSQDVSFGVVVLIMSVCHFILAYLPGNLKVHSL